MTYYPASLTAAMERLTAAGWKPTLERQTSADGPDFPDDLDISYISVTLDGSPEPHRPDTGRVVEIFVSTCDCPEEAEQDEAAHLGGAVAGNDGPPGRGFMVVYLDEGGVDEVAEDHVDLNELDEYARFWLRGDGYFAGPNPFCSNRSEAGDACGACPGCIAEMERIRGELRP